MAGSGTAHLRPGQGLLSVEHLRVEFGAPRGQTVKAVSDVSFDVLPGETLGLVGESGCGKSTVARTVVQLHRATAGRIVLKGVEMTSLRGAALRRSRASLQMVFQDPIASLNPWRKVIDIVLEPLAVWDVGSRRERLDKARSMLDTVGLDPDVVGQRRAAELSGGQCQRVAIARALMLDPDLVVCDEPVSSLDVSVQAQIINLLEDMKERYGLTLVFISHDLAVVRAVSDRIAVMYAGKLCEVGHAADLYDSPAHPYAALLISSVPQVGIEAPTVDAVGLAGELPSPVNPPAGCRFRSRCGQASERCATEEPVMRQVRPDRFVACHHPLREAP